MNRHFIILSLLLLAVFTACKKSTRSEAGSNDFFSNVDTTEEILLPSADGNGGEMSIEKLKGNVVIMDVLYSTPEMNDKHIATLRKLYSEYSSQGLEIYQICMDTIPERWGAVAKTLPWVAVYDDNTLKSKLLAKYKVMTIPSMQLFDREGNKLSGAVTSATVEEAVKKALK